MMHVESIGTTEEMTVGAGLCAGPREGAEALPYKTGSEGAEALPYKTGSEGAEACPDNGEQR